MTRDQAIEKLHQVLSDSTTTVLTEYTQHVIAKAVTQISISLFLIFVAVVGARKFWVLSKSFEVEDDKYMGRVIVSSVAGGAIFLGLNFIAYYLPDLIAPKAVAIRELVSIFK